MEALQWNQIYINQKELYNMEKANMPLELVPKEMKNIKSEIICKGYMYIVSFDKP